jgi:hypothetical protein
MAIETERIYEITRDKFYGVPLITAVYGKAF